MLDIRIRIIKLIYYLHQNHRSLNWCVGSNLKVNIWCHESQSLKLLVTLQVTNVYKVHSKEQMPEIASCDENNEFQVWAFTWRFAWNQVPKHVMDGHLLSQL